MPITSGNPTIDRILSGESAKIKAGIIAFIRDGRPAFGLNGTAENGWRTRFIGETASGTILLPYRETAELIEDGVIEINDQYRLRLAVRPIESAR